MHIFFLSFCFILHSWALTPWRVPLCPCLQWKHLGEHYLRLFSESLLAWVYDTKRCLETKWRGPPSPVWGESRSVIFSVVDQSCRLKKKNTQQTSRFPTTRQIIASSVNSTAIRRYRKSCRGNKAATTTGLARKSSCKEWSQERWVGLRGQMKRKRL